MISPVQLSINYLLYRYIFIFSCTYIYILHVHDNIHIHTYTMLTCGSKYADVIIMCVCFSLGPTACIGDPRTHRQGFLMSSNSMLKNINFQGADLGRAASEGTLCGPVTLNQYRIRCVLCYSRGNRRGAPYLLPTPPHARGPPPPPSRLMDHPHRTLSST